MKKFYEEPNIELIRSVSFIATSQYNSYDKQDGFDDGEGNNIDDLFGGGN